MSKRYRNKAEKTASLAKQKAQIRKKKSVETKKRNALSLEETLDPATLVAQSSIESSSSSDIQQDQHEDKRVRTSIQNNDHRASVSIEDSMIIDDEEEELDINKDNLINNSSEGPSIIIEEDRDCMEIDLDVPKVTKKLEFLESIKVLDVINEVYLLQGDVTIRHYDFQSVKQAMALTTSRINKSGKSALPFKIVIKRSFLVQNKKPVDKFYNILCATELQAKAEELPYRLAVGLSRVSPEQWNTNHNSVKDISLCRYHTFFDANNQIRKNILIRNQNGITIKLSTDQKLEEKLRQRDLKKIQAAAKLESTRSLIKADKKLEEKFHDASPDEDPEVVKDRHKFTTDEARFIVKQKLNHEIRCRTYKERIDKLEIRIAEFTALKVKVHQAIARQGQGCPFLSDNYKGMNDEDRDFDEDEESRESEVYSAAQIMIVKSFLGILLLCLTEQIVGYLKEINLMNQYLSIIDINKNQSQANKFVAEYNESRIAYSMPKICAQVVGYWNSGPDAINHNVIRFTVSGFLAKYNQFKQTGFTAIAKDLRGKHNRLNVLERYGLSGVFELYMKTQLASKESYLFTTESCMNYINNDLLKHILEEDINETTFKPKEKNEDGTPNDKFDPNDKTRHDFPISRTLAFELIKIHKGDYGEITKVCIIS